MSFMHPLLKRRQFLTSSISSAAMLAFGRLSKAFGFAVQGGAAKKPLKGIVVYYSATGSTGKIAKAIYQGMKSVIDCDVAPLKKIDPQKMAKYDVIAIGGPIWYYRETANLRLFIYRMPNMAGKLCVPFCTHGTQPSGFFWSLDQPLRKKEFTIIGWRDWYGAASHVLHMPKPYVTDGHPDEIDMNEARAFGKEMAERATRIVAGEKNLIPEIPTGPDTDPLWLKGGMDSLMGGMPSPVGNGARSGGETARGSAAGGPGMSMPGGNAAAAGGPGRGTTGGGATTSAEPGRGTPAAGGPGAQGGAGMRGAGGPGGRGGRGPGAVQTVPKINTLKCVYPRCTACIDNCVANALRFSITSPAASVSGSSIFVQGCIHCGQPFCERACNYDALLYEVTDKTKHVIDMKKCTYPKCTLCADNCPMNAIDFSGKQPVYHNQCEGCDLCWCVCPKDAISITNLADTHMLLENSETGPDSPFLANLNAAEKTGRFRRLMPIDKVGWGHVVYKNPNAPRVVLNPEDYPFEVAQKG
jgi:ferredoxin/flavodoxin